MRALDLFAGTGWGVACKALGIEEFGVDNAEEVVQTRALNGMATVFRDAWDGLHDESLVPEHELLIASPPCQTFSRAGSGAGREALDQVVQLVRERAYMRIDDMRAFALAHGDERTALVLAPLAYAFSFEPEYVVFEQVPPVLPVWEACAVELEAMGYSTWTGVLTAEQYGVPQTRQRAILIARRDGEPAAPPTPTHSRYHSRSPLRLDPDVLPWVSMAEALRWAEPSWVGFPRMADDKGDAVEIDGVAYRKRDLRSSDEPAFNLTSKARSWKRYEIDREALAAIVAPRVNNQSGTEFDLAWPADRPAPVIAGRDLVTMPGANANRYNGRTKSRNDGIHVTLEEAAVLQSYPWGFQWTHSRTSGFQQVGNAVAPVFGQAVLEAATS